MSSRAAAARRPPPPPPILRETLDRLPSQEALDRLPPDRRPQSPFPPGAEVVTTWKIAWAWDPDKGRYVEGDAEVSAQRLAGEEDREAHRAAASVPAAVRGAPEVVPPTEATLQVLTDLADRVKRGEVPERPAPTAAELARDEWDLRRFRGVRAGIPADYLDALAAPEARPALQLVRAWQGGSRRALLLHGANQAGKSVAAAWWLASLDGGMWAEGEAIGLAVQPDDSGESVAWLRRLRKASALVIDNVGARCGDAGYEEIEALLMHALARQRRVIVTTDFDKAQFFALFGDDKRNRIRSRWDLFGEAKPVPPWRGAR